MLEMVVQVCVVTQLTVQGVCVSAVYREIFKALNFLGITSIL